MAVAENVRRRRASLYLPGPVPQGKYSSLEWDHTMFDAVDYDGNTKEQRIYLLKGKVLI
jgi:hypothetical protein